MTPPRRCTPNLDHCGLGLVAALAAMRTTTDGQWLTVWLCAAVLAVAVSLWTNRLKAMRLDLPLWSGPSQRFALGFCPPLVAGAVLTVVVYGSPLSDRLPGIWLLIYGASVAAGGAASIRLIPLMGAAFIATGIAALVTPAALGDWFMAFGFGVLHIVFGIPIVRQHGG